MKKFALIAILACIFSTNSNAQQPIRLDYFSTIPASIKKCGALYAYDSINLNKKKYILLTDFQDQGLITVAGKQVKLHLDNTNTVGQTNISTYTGSGYTVVLSVKTTSQNGDIDIETGTAQITKGTKTVTLKIHGESKCQDGMN